MCGCNKTINPSQQTPETVNENCSYTLPILTELKRKLLCIKDQELFTETNSTESKINSYIGFVTSAIYYPADFCYFQETLDELTLFLTPLTLSDCNV